MTATETKSKYPIAVFELLKKGSGSGFVREDTVRTANPIEIIHPKNRAIINRSVVREKSKDKKGNEIFVNVPIRYIYGSELIMEKEQKQEGILPNPKKDRIEFKNGFLTVPKDGATVGLYEFLINHAQNISNPEREGHFNHLEAIFREVKPAEDAQHINVSEFAQAEAVMYIKGLVIEKGKGYVFSEERIDALCNLFNIAAESYEQKVSALTYFAKTNPQYFLIEAKKSEQVAIIEVTHGVKLKVIVFEGQTAMYVAKNEKIKSFTGNLNTEEKKINALANFFKSVDGAEPYEIFKAELAAAKEAAISQQ